MRLILMIFSSLVITAFSLTSWATECTSNGNCCKKLNELWQTKYYNIDFKVGSTPFVEAKSSFKCPSHFSRMAEAFMVIDNLSKLDEAFEDYYSTLRESTEEFTFYVGTNEDWATTNIHFFSIIVSYEYDKELSPSTYAETLIHEGTHAAHSNFHVNCKKGLVKDERACDEFLDNTLDTESPYTRSFIFLHNLREMDVTDLQKKTAKARMQFMFENHFNSVPSKGPDDKTPVRDYYDI